MSGRARFVGLCIGKMESYYVAKGFLMSSKTHCSHVRVAILYGSKTWCLRENEMGILQRAERCMVRAMCGLQLKDKKSEGLAWLE